MTTEPDVLFTMGFLIIVAQASVQVGIRIIGDYLSKKNNGHTPIIDDLDILRDTMIAGFKDAKDERSILFDRVHEIRTDVSELREKVAYMNGKNTK